VKYDATQAASIYGAAAISSGHHILAFLGKDA